jgi:NitT/TauT family transport system ATP-binding protein
MATTAATAAAGTAATTRPLVRVAHVRHYWGSGQNRRLILDDIDLTINDREVVGLLGRSGSGKSTLLRTIAGLIAPSEGDVAFQIDRADRPAVGMVFQTFALFPWLTVLENVELGLEAQRIPAPERRTRALAAIDLIGLDGFENAYPKELSGGMRQRVGLARALVVDPALLLMDEPFSALDVLTAETLRTDLLDLWADGRMPIRSILIVTHNIEEAVLMCDRILIFAANPGRVAAEIRVDLPQPRDRLDPAFRALDDSIYARMTGGARPHLPEPAPATIALVLPPVSTNSLAGLIEEVDGAPFDGRASMADLAEQLQLEADELFPIAEALQLLRFADLAEGEIVLTPAARRYAGAEVDARKTLFAGALLAHVPLARHIRRVLDERPGHSAPARRFRDELEDHMSPDYAATTLTTVTHWGRYAELFSYVEDGDRFSLDDPG